MDPKEMAAAIVGGDAPPPSADGDVAPGDAGPEGVDDADMGLQTAAGDLMAAIDSKDAAGVASALRSAFQMLEASPHEEAAEPEA